MNVRFCLALTFVVIMLGTFMTMAQETMKPPVAKKEPKVLKIHGYEITDNYAWLRDRNREKESGDHQVSRSRECLHRVASWASTRRLSTIFTRKCSAASSRPI